MPGKWAAPPAPAIMTCKPRDCALLRVRIHPIRRAMSRYDSLFVRDFERIQDIRRATHGRPVGLTTHYDADAWRCHACGFAHAMISGSRRSSSAVIWSFNCNFFFFKRLIIS